MRIIFKILAAPFVPVLTVLWAVLVFVFCFGATVLNLLSGVGVLLAIVLFCMGQTTGGIVFAVIAFLISPVGLPAIVSWLIDKIFDVKENIKDFITA